MAVENEAGMRATGGESIAELTGQRLGQFQVEELIGQGGMARVYRAFQPSLERYIAIKVIPVPPDATPDQDFLRRFIREAKLIARLAHPNIVTVHDFGEETGWAYIVMEYIAGGTVRDRLAEAASQGRRLGLDRTLHLMSQAALALDFAHQRGVIHRDIKPANMLLRTEEHLLLTDFGIATILEANRAFSRAGANIGTPQYMAPEQGIPGGAVDARTDIYALGVVLFHCVTGQLPFAGESPAVLLAQHQRAPVPRPSSLVPGLPPVVERVILRAIAKDPAGRYQHAREMAAELERARSVVRSLAAQGRVPGGRMDTLVTGALPPGAVASGGPLPPRGAAGAAPAIAGPAQVCFRCGAPNEPRNHFCTVCGYDLSGRRGEADRFLLPNGKPLLCRLTWTNGPLLGRQFLLHQDATTIGRTAESDITLPDRHVSRNHARVSFLNGQWFLEDLESRNGTLVNGTLIKRPAPLMTGDQIRIGDDVLLFELVS
jgi:hypothetical protein